MKIIEGKRKVKIVFEYFKRNPFNFDSTTTKEVNIKVFLKDGRTITTDEISDFTINKKSDKK